jgi:hypothetical protein
MARINWIKGELKGRLGEIVGSSWKGHSYTKTYTKPANPNTPAQIEIRAVFQNIAHIGKRVREPLERYTRPKPHGMTAYNHLIQQNKPLFQKQGKKWDPLGFVFMTGELAGAEISTAVFDGAALTATVTWDGTTGEADDKAFVIIYDDESKRVAYTVDVARSAGTVTLDAAGFANVSSYTEVYAYLAFYKINPDGSGVNSTTTALKATKS